eukprot:941897-Prorocentrum_minimum.AAC.1
MTVTVTVTMTVPRLSGGAVCSPLTMTMTVTVTMTVPRLSGGAVCCARRRRRTRRGTPRFRFTANASTPRWDGHSAWTPPFGQGRRGADWNLSRRAEISRGRLPKRSE